ncbi:MAG: aminotransferase class I/II-fold pyridoxal phosphate-dependent enzyme [candidate division KSB1 bacterium]|nr:aminotransferase class I/II-fold pyridoxal phosphate-dependent enzyme [candidate division KSB1 bacterium]MDZ7318359.1 aminotransferase class I/II-fold pyridoxal phosphate-dependent enzyme [candidate division KSB1 bacterium]
MKGRPLTPPVVLSATYEFDSSDDLIDVVQHRSGYIYSRWDNPTVREVEGIMARLEGYETALGFSSGMAAITTAILAFTRQNSRIVAMNEVYGGTFQFLYGFLPRLGIETVGINCEKTDQLLSAINAGLDVLYLETPTNPLLRVIEVQPLVEAAHRRGAVVILDSTFASPINQHPRDFGVDVVIHSATKYLGGHHDVTAGFACCDQRHFDAIWEYRKIMGGVMDPLSAFLIARGLHTLEIRVHKQNENALQIAQFLSQHHRIRMVNYPGLPSHPDHQIARRQMKGFGGMLSFEVAADFDGTKRFMDHLQVIKLATSLGGVTSLANQPITNTHAALNPEERAKAGISESLVRLSVGIEDPQLLINDLEQALRAI